MSVIGVFIGKIEAYNKSGQIARSFLLIPQNISFAGRGKLNPSHRSSRGLLKIRTGGLITGYFNSIIGGNNGVSRGINPVFSPENTKIERAK